MIGSGKLRHRVTIESLTETPDAYGERDLSWSTYATRWASVEPLQGREFFQAREYGADVSVRIRLRYDSLTKDVTPKMRIVFGSKTYNIESVMVPNEIGEQVVVMGSVDV